APFLVFRDGSGQEQVVSLEGDNQRLTIGRGSATDVWLEWDREASRVHAALERYGQEWTVVDDGLSRNGTFVNGERVHGHHRLADGDVVRCGSTELLFVARSDEGHSRTIEPGTAPTEVRPDMTVQVPTVDAAADDQVSQRAFRNVPGRIAEALLGQVTGEEDEAVVSLTHAALADIAGTSRETVSRFLAQLERAGVLTLGRRQITIHRPATLRNY